jgi:hypothetical protein
LQAQSPGWLQQGWAQALQVLLSVVTQSVALAAHHRL